METTTKIIITHEVIIQMDADKPVLESAMELTIQGSDNVKVNEVTAISIKKLEK